MTPGPDSATPRELGSKESDRHCPKTADVRFSNDDSRVGALIACKMDGLFMIALSVPLSAWGMRRAYSWLALGTSHATLSSYILLVGLAALVIKVNLSLVNKSRFSSRARALGCGSVAVYPHKDPILGLDAFLEALRALRSHTLLDLFVSRFATCGGTYYTLTLGKWLLMTNEVENIKTILIGIDDWPIDGPRLLGTLPVLGPDSIFTSNGEAWHKARTMLRPSFVRDQVADLKCFGRHILNFLAAIPPDGTAFDIQNLLFDMTMDSSTDFLLGYSTNRLTKPSPEADEFVKSFEYASRESANNARLGPILAHLPHPKLRDAVRRLREYVRVFLKEAVAAKKEGGGAQDRSYVFLDELLKANPPEDYTIDQILSILIAGRDTTAATITAAFYFLARNPAVVEKLREEISSVDDEIPTWEQLKHMKYLNNVIREALRLFSPVASNSRAASKETVLPCGGGKDGKQPILVPKGTPVRWTSHALHRNKDVFGPDADEFRPERWDSDLRVGWEYIPFSGGPRICLGQQFALTQVAYTLFKFFRTFRAIEARDHGPFLAQTNITISFPYGCLVSVTRA